MDDKVLQLMATHWVELRGCEVPLSGLERRLTWSGLEFWTSLVWKMWISFLLNSKCYQLGIICCLYGHRRSSTEQEAKDDARHPSTKKMLKWVVEVSLVNWLKLFYLSLFRDYCSTSLRMGYQPHRRRVNSSYPTSSPSSTTHSLGNTYQVPTSQLRRRLYQTGDTDRQGE